MGDVLPYDLQIKINNGQVLNIYDLFKLCITQIMYFIFA